jgi:aminoglycoside phosphotransferase (APT) family kinase protein
MTEMFVGLDPGWIASHVEIGGVTPRDVEFAGFIGTGQMSRNARWSLDWGTNTGPSSIVVKIPSADETVRNISFEHGIYQKECAFYRSVKALTEVAAPALIALHVGTDDFCLVLEDLAGSRQGDQFTEATDEQLILAIDQAAALHAPVWGAVAQPAFDIFREDPAERAAGYAERMAFFHAVVQERLGAGLDADVADLLAAFVETAPRYIGRAAPVTLVHGDFRPDNFLFGVDDGAPPIMVVDWQTLSLGSGTTDVAYLLGAAVTPERRREIEHDMLARYVGKLAGRGINHPAQQCLEEYALGSLHGVVIAMTATVMAEQTERGDALFTLMLNRHGRHALDMGALDRLG